MLADHETGLPFIVTGARVERVDRPVPGLYAFTLYGNSLRRVVLVSVGHAQPTPRWAIVLTRPTGDQADGEVRGLREKLEGGRVTSAKHRTNTLCLEVRRGDITWWVSGTRKGVECSQTAPDTHLLGEDIDTDAEKEATGRGENLITAHRQALTEVARETAESQLRRLYDRLVRRRDAIEGDLSALSHAQHRAANAALFLPAAAKAPTGTLELEATDWASGSPEKKIWTLDPHRPAREQLEAIFAKAKRLRKGAAIAARRRSEVEQALALIAEARSQVRSAEDERLVASVLKRLSGALPHDIRLRKPGATAPEKKNERKAVRQPFRCYTSVDGAPIWVGRNAACNDTLTVRYSKPGDLWLHVKNAPGAHVIVPRAAASPDATLLADAATLAAHFSELRGERVIDVAYADRRHVRKRKGSAPGLVEVLREKVIAVRMEAERVGRLLATCDQDDRTTD